MSVTWRGKTMNKRKRLLALLINGMLLSSICVASAADVTVGAGNGVAYGTGSKAPKAENVAIVKMQKLNIVVVWDNLLLEIL